MLVLIPLFLYLWTSGPALSVLHHFPLLLQSLGVKCKHLGSMRRWRFCMARSWPSTMSSDKVRIYWPCKGREQNQSPWKAPSVSELANYSFPLQVISYLIVIDEVEVLKSWYHILFLDTRDLTYFTKNNKSENTAGNLYLQSICLVQYKERVHTWWWSVVVLHSLIWGPWVSPEWSGTSMSGRRAGPNQTVVSLGYLSFLPPLRAHNLVKQWPWHDLGLIFHK